MSQSERALPLILVADDDLEVQKMVQAALKSIGAPLVFASSGDEAVEKYLTDKPRLVILDVMMPGLSGWEVVKYIRDHDPEKKTAILMLTGIGERLNAATSPLIGADDFLDKPFNFATLADRVRRLLEQK
jgi:two-component system alkaline phosphatase synthesis response regulator PhoP